MNCKWLSDDFSEICVNADCPVCTDFCPLGENRKICKFYEEKKDKNGKPIGVWVKVDATIVYNKYGFYSSVFKCSLCGNYSPFNSKFCCNCGATMESKE